MDPVMRDLADYLSEQEDLDRKAEREEDEAYERGDHSLAKTPEALGFTHVPFTLEALHEILGDEVEEYGEAYGEDAKRRAANEIGQTLAWIWVAGREAA